MQTYKSSSNVKPLPIDTSSEFYMYVHRDILKIVQTDKITGQPEVVYSYTVDRYTKQEWNELQVSNAQIQITEQDLEQITQGQIITDIDLRLTQLGGAK